MSEFLKKFFADKTNIILAAVFAVVFISSLIVLNILLTPVLGADSQKLEYTVSIDIAASKSGVVKLYYDNGLYTKFDESCTVSVPLEAKNVFQTLEFTVPASGRKYLKFSFSNENGTQFYIRQIRIESFSSVLTIDSGDIPAMFDVHDRMSNFFDKGSYVGLKATGANSDFLNTAEIEKLYAKPTLPLIILAAALLFASAAAYVVFLALKVKGFWRKPSFVLTVALFVSAVIFTVFCFIDMPSAVRIAVPAVLCAAAIALFVCAMLRGRKSGGKRRAADIASVALLSVVFCGFLLTGTVFAVLDTDDDSSLPSYSISTFMDFSSSAEERFSSGNPFVSTLREAYSDIKTYVFLDSQTDAVIIGADGWLFDGDEMSDYKRLVTLDKSDLQKIRDNLRSLETMLTANGAQLYIMLTPDKSTVYEDKIPAYIRRNNTDSLLEQIDSHLYKYSELKVINVTDALTAEKTDNDVYYFADNGINQRGAFVSVNAVLSFIASDFPDVAPLAIENCDVENLTTVMKTLAAELGKEDSYRMTEDYITPKVEADYTVENLNYNPYQNVSEGEAYTKIDKTSIFSDDVKLELSLREKNYDETSYYVNIKNPDVTNDLKLLVIHDEASVNMMSYFAAAFSDSTFVIDDTVSTKYLFGINPDVVILQISEKNLLKLLDW